jgi:tRNA (mo5U34)-methyltransferase
VQTERSEEIRSKILGLAPWYFDIEVTAGLRTSLYLDEQPRQGAVSIVVDLVNPVDGSTSQSETFVPAENVSGAMPRLVLGDPRDDFLRTLNAIYPKGLEGRSVLDCGCNSGAYLFLAKEAGAGGCFGFDARELWIEQASFLAENRDPPTDGMRFEVLNLYDVPSLGLEPSDVVLFNGLFYHLPDPISALRIAADLTKETLIINTAARRGIQEGALVPTEQPRNQISGGLYGLRWLPTGPNVLFRLLGWMGFNEVRCSWWRPRGQLRDRIEVVAGREEGSLASFDSSLGEGERRISSIVSTSVPPNTDVLVASGGNEALLEIEGRRGWHFPQLPDGSYRRDIAAHADAVIAELESLRAAGAQYLVVPLERSTGLEPIPDVLDRVRKRFNLLRPGPFCRIFELDEPDKPPFRPQADEAL